MILTAKMEAFAVARASPSCESDVWAYKQAYSAGGMSDKTISRKAFDLMQNGHVAARVREIRNKQAVEIIFECRDVLREWLDIATANPAELCHTRQLNCRHCWGVEHAYQWKNDAEFTAAVVAVMEYNAQLEGTRGRARERPYPTDEGGYGFKRLERPHPRCPECDGEGIADTYVADITRVSPKARKLFAGIKQTNAGPQILMRDQDKALESIAKYFGMFTENIRLLVPGAAVPPSVGNMTAADAGKIYAAIVTGAAPNALPAPL